MEQTFIQIAASSFYVLWSNVEPTKVLDMPLTDKEIVSASVDAHFQFFDGLFYFHCHHFATDLLKFCMVVVIPILVEITDIRYCAEIEGSICVSYLFVIHHLYVVMFVVTYATAFLWHVNSGTFMFSHEHTSHQLHSLLAIRIFFHLNLAGDGIGRKIAMFTFSQSLFGRCILSLLVAIQLINLRPLGADSIRLEELYYYEIGNRKLPSLMMTRIFSHIYFALLIVLLLITTTTTIKYQSTLNSLA